MFVHSYEISYFLKRNFVEYFFNFVYFAHKNRHPDVSIKGATANTSFKRMFHFNATG